MDKTKGIIDDLKIQYSYKSSLYYLLFDCFRYKNNFISDILTIDQSRILLQEILNVQKDHKEYEIIKKNAHETIINYEDSNITINAVYSLCRNLVKTGFEDNKRVIKLNSSEISKFESLFSSQGIDGGAGPIIVPAPPSIGIMPDDSVKEFAPNIYLNVEDTMQFLIFINEFLPLNNDVLLQLGIDPIIVDNKTGIIQEINKIDGKNIDNLVNFLNSKSPDGIKLMLDSFEKYKIYLDSDSEYRNELNKTVYLIENHKSSDYFIMRISIYDKNRNHYIEREFELNNETVCGTYYTIIYGLYKLL